MLYQPLSQQTIDMSLNDISKALPFINENCSDNLNSPICNLKELLNTYCICELSKEAMDTNSPSGYSSLNEYNQLYSGYKNEVPQIFSLPVENHNLDISQSEKRLSNLSKSKMNMKLLKDYNCSVEKKRNTKGGITTVYTCQYNKCYKEFTRTWSILDHVRMHEGIRPYICNYCNRTYTQKGNMLKHMKRHTQPSVEGRRNYL
mmetsp:Transcript_18167/g.16071  ORF Transcript_18167/g.16071 Transcript_18167/m.16071 type:complete len:203 (+) Transcript_18167:38-646(+)